MNKFAKMNLPKVKLVQSFSLKLILNKIISILIWVIQWYE